MISQPDTSVVIGKTSHNGLNNVSHNFVVKSKHATNATWIKSDVSVSSISSLYMHCCLYLDFVCCEI